MSYSDKDLERIRRNPDIEIVEEYPALRQADLGLVPKRKRQAVLEHDLQAEVVRRCLGRAGQDPAWGLVFAIPNGQYRGGQRMEAGLRAGVPDLFVPAMRGGYGGLFIELKCGYNRPSKKQEEWIAALQAQGYYCVVVWDEADKVLAEIERYLSMPGGGA